jgi:NTP pyrophosphatase (non-canonical NTP hydrolase)
LAQKTNSSKERDVSNKPFNQLTDGQAERLALLLEELGEAQQAIGKILRHGYESYHPDGGESNRENLQKELGDVLGAIELMTARGDLVYKTIHHYRTVKLANVKQWLHHQVLP